MQQSSSLTIGVDLGDQKSHVCLLSPEGEVCKREQLKTERADLNEYFSASPKATVVLEAGSQSPWISRLIESRGHQVIIANPAQVRLIHGTRRKNDRLDAEKLARLARVDVSLLRPIRHWSEHTHADLCVIRARDLLVRTRTQLVNYVRGVLKAFGIKPPEAGAACFHRKVLVHVPPQLEPAIEPVLASLATLNEQIKRLDKKIDQLARERYPRTAVLQQVNGVGQLIALTFILTLEDASRFANSRKAGAYLGLVPGQDQSGDYNPQRSITKQGNVLLRRLLVQASHYTLGPFGRDSDLRRYGLAIAGRGGKNGKKRAMSAVARKLAVLLHRLWTTGEVYQPLRNSASPTPGSC